MSQAQQEEIVFLGLGSNLGDRLAFLQRAVDRLQEQPDVTVVRASPVYASEPHTLTPHTHAPDYLNAVVHLQTTGTPAALLDACKKIEQETGRSATAERWAPRPLDLDILLYGMRHIETPTLQVPHPRLLERRFVLLPLADLSPDQRLPYPKGLTVRDALTACTDSYAIHPTSFQLLIQPAPTP